MERFKKIFAAGVIFVTVLSMSVVVAPAGATASAGDLIKMAGLSSVYYLAADGKRYVFPNESTYFSWYSDFSGVVTIPQSELESYPLGANVTVRPGTKLVKITTNPKVYAVIANGNLLAIPDEATAAALYGANWNKRIIDVSDAFFTNYTISSSVVSATAYPAGSLVKFGTEADVFYINADGTASKITTEAAFTANRFKWADVISATIAKPSTSTDIAAAIGTLTDTSSGAGGTADAGTGLTVALASDTPAAATVITNTTATTGNGQAYVPFSKVNFTAAADGDVKVTNLKFKRTGISADADVESLYLYDGATRLTAEASISSNIATFNNANGLFTVTKGTTKSITLRGDMLFSATSGKTIGFNVVAATDVTTNGATVSGSFPIAGNLMSTANATDLGKLVVTNNFPEAAQTVDPDSVEAEVAKFNFVGSEQALSVEKIVFTEIGSVQTDDLANFKLLDPGGAVIGEVAAMNSSYEVIFDLSAAPYQMTKGVTKILSLRADIVKGSTRTFYFSVQNKYDILVKDTSYNVYVEPYSAGSFAVAAPAVTATSIFTINSGSLSINRTTTAPTGNVTLDGTNIVVGEWDFRASGEDMKVKDLSIVATTSAYGGLDNAKVYVNGAQVGSTKDLSAAAAAVTTWGFGSSFVVTAGTTAKVQVIADIKTSTSTSYSNADTVKVSVASSASNIQKMTSLGYQAAIAAVDGTAAVLTISAAALSVSKYSGYGNQTVIAGSNNVRLGSFILAAGSAEGVNVSSITVTLSADEYATVTNMYLKDNATGATLGTAKNVPGLSNIYSMSPNIALAANGSKLIDLYANVIASSNAGSWIAKIDASGSGIVTGGSVASVVASQDLQTMTVAANGTLTVTNGSMPDAAIVLAGSTGNYVAEYQFSAVNEGFTVDKLKLKVTNNFATSTSGVSLSYKDKAGATKTADGVFITGTEANATATFTGLTMYVPADSDANLKVYISLTSTAYGATSGANSAITLDANEGFNATGDSGTVDTDSPATDKASNSFYVRKTKPTFAKQTLTGAPSTGNSLFKFTVVADNAGNIEIKQLGFTVTTNGMDVTSLYLYDTNAGVQLTDTPIVMTTTGESVKLVVGRAAGTAGAASDDDIITVSSSDSPVKTFEVRGTVSNYTSADSDSMTLKFKQDTTATSTASAATTIAQNNYNVWTDRSASGHATTTTDWTGGYLLKDMTQLQQLP